MKYEVGNIVPFAETQEATDWVNSVEGGYYLEDYALDENGNMQLIVRQVEYIELTPEEKAAKALEQAKIKRAEAVASIVVEVDGMVFDGDEKAQERMVRAVTLADSPEETNEWVLHDNTVAIVTAEQLRRACKLAGKTQTALWIKPYTDSKTETHYTME